MRVDNRNFEDIRDVKITKNYLNKIPTSVLVEFGDTKVLCTSSFENKQPPFLLNTESGWITAEYSMLPMSTEVRIQRERNKISGRTQEIQRLIGRALRTVVDLNKLNKCSIIVDCDVLQADGGTRTASITGAYVSLHILLEKMLKDGVIQELPIKDSVSAISVGIVEGNICVDLNYYEDSNAEVDMNFVITGNGSIVEVQGTAEKEPFSKKILDLMYEKALISCKKLSLIQKETLKECL